MGSFSIWHWLVVLAVVLLLFGGKGKISALMGDFGKGLKSFKQGVKGDDAEGEASEQANRSVTDDSGSAKSSSKSDQAVKG
jgi:sec-independent protein translocase protein TatA